MTHKQIRTMVETALFAAVLAILSQLSIPLPSGVPITLQTFAVALAAYTLGVRAGTASVGIYLALGAVGIPVFAQFTGGFAKLTGVTGGFLWGFLPMAALCGLAVYLFEKMPSRAAGGVLCAVLSIAGLMSCHLLGVVQFALVSGSSLGKSFLTVSLPFLLKDLLSCGAALALALVLRRALGLSRQAVKEPAN